MNEQTKPVTGSNEHLAEIESRIAALEAGQGKPLGVEDGKLETVAMQLQNSVSILTTKVSELEGTLGTAQTNISQLKSSVSYLNSRVDAQKAHIESLERVNPAG